MKNNTKILDLRCFVQNDKVDGFVRDYDGSKYLVLFGLEKYDLIYDRIRYFIGLKGSIT